MPDYGEILAFLAANPPYLEAERELHASLLELLAQCLRSDQVVCDDAEQHTTAEPEDAEADEPSDMLAALAASHARWGRVH